MHRRYVDEVVIGSPCVITEDLMTTFNISVVVRGSMSETSMLGPVEEVSRGMGQPGAAGRAWVHGLCLYSSGPDAGRGGCLHHCVVCAPCLDHWQASCVHNFNTQERYEVPRRMGLFTELPSPSDVSARNIIHRIVDKRAAFEARNAKKVKGEEAYYTGAKQYVQEL